MNPLLFGFIVYLFALIIIGGIASKYMKNISDFFIGGWRVGPLVCAISERASGESAWFLLGLPGLAYASGCEAFWPVIGCACGIYISWTFIAKKLREVTGKYNAITIPDLLESMIDDRTHIIRIISTLIILFFYTLYVGAQFIGAGKILNATFGITHLQGMIIGAAIVIFYTVIGGFLAVAWTDVLQGLLMLFVSFFMPLFSIIKIGGAEIFSKINSINPNLLNITGGKLGHGLILGTAIGGLGIGIGYLGQPHLLTRYMAIHKREQIRQGVLIAMIWVLLAYWGAAFIGIVAKGIIPEITDQEQVMPILAKYLFSPWIAGIMISGAIAAMMSTADTQLLVAASSVAEDIYHQLIGKQVNEKILIIISRTATLIIGIFAFILAIKSQELIYSLVLYAWSGLASSFGPPIILSLYRKKINRNGVIAGLISGTTITIIWHNIPFLKNLIYELIPAFIISSLVTILFSLKK